MNILVTGGAGFIGSHLVDNLIAQDHKVVVIDNLSTGRKENLNKEARFYQLDITDKKIEAVFKKEEFDYIFHLAAQIDVRKSVKDPIFDAQVNILGSLNLLENARKFKLNKFIFASTGGAIYGDTDNLPTPESHPEQPVSPYGIAKLAVEKYLLFYQKNYGLGYTALRYANVYGPRQNPEGEAGVVAIFLDKLLKGEQPIINGDGKQARDYVYIADVVRATTGALEKKGTIYNVGWGKETNVIELFQRIIKLGQFQAEEKHGPALKGEQQRSCLDCSKIEREWGFRPSFNLEQGLKETIKWFRKRAS